MVHSDPRLQLPTSAELPCSDDTPGDTIYGNLGVRYYVVYNPEYWQRDGHQPFEVYQLSNGVYQLQVGEPFWMPEVGLGLGRSRYQSGKVQREVLSWFDQQNQRY